MFANIPQPETEPQTEVETMSCQECKRWIYDDRWGWFCPLKSQDECKYEPKEKPQTLKGGEDVHEFCKRCGESKARTIDGERYIVCEKASDMACVSIKKCPLGKWVCEETYIVVPQTDCALMKGADDDAD